MVVALVVLVITLAIATVALTATLDSRVHATRDLRSQRALQAADAGINSGIYRLGQLNLASFNFSGGTALLGTLADCVIPKATVNANGGVTITGYSFTAQASVATGACPLPSGSGVGNAIGDTVKVGNHSFYEMQQIGGATTTGVLGPNIVLHPKIVAVGVEDAGNSATCSASASTVVGAVTTGCVARRILATLAPIDPFQVVEATGNLAINAGALGSTVVNGDVRTNGTFTQSGGLLYVSTNALNGALIGNVTYGVGTPSTSLVPVTTFTKKSSSVSRTPITVNDANCATTCTQADLPSGVTALTLGGLNASGTAAYSSTTHAVTMTRGTMIFTPGDYIFCDFNVTGGTVETNIPANSTTPVRIFVDSPTSSRCNGNGLGTTQGTFRSSTGVSNLVSLVSPNSLQIYVAGGSSTTTPVNIAGGLSESMFLYAPSSDVSMTVTAFSGALIGDNVTITGQTGLALTLTQNLGLNNYTLANGVGVFHVAQYSECTPVYPLPEPDPTVGC